MMNDANTPTAPPSATQSDAFLGVDTPRATQSDAFLGVDTPRATQSDAFLGVDNPLETGQWPFDDDVPLCEDADEPSYYANIKMPLTEVGLPMLPHWVIEKTPDNDVDIWRFVNWFIAAFDVRCISYRLYLGNESISHCVLRRKVIDEIEPFAYISVQKLGNIMRLLEDKSVCEPPEVMPEAIYFKNHTLVFCDRPPADAAQQPRKADKNHRDVTLVKAYPAPFSLCRVPHDFDQNAKEPTRFLAFLDELLYPQDIQTLQQYLGYCLMPSTKAQKALFLIGQGGEGKSRLTYLMQQVLGDTSMIASVGDLADRFFATNLEHRLLMIDDDLQSNKFTETDIFKTLVTNENKVLVEPKGKQHYEIRPYVRLLFMGNQSVGSLHDRSDGFYRRVHIIQVRPRRKDRLHNPDLIQEIWAAEKAGILLWLVKGALQLARQNYILTESRESTAALVALKYSDNTALEFLKEQNFVYGEGYSITSARLTGKYKAWCEENDLHKMSGQSFKQTCERYFAKGGGQYSPNIRTCTGKARGYKGVNFCYQ